jgi:hypothetical protein
MAETQTLIKQHNFVNEAKFRAKISLLILKRGFKNLFSGTKKFRSNGQLRDLPIVAVSESELWNIDDNEQNWALTAGKVQNLRIAAKRLNGLEIPANEAFSFWRHIGNPNFGKDYVIGREIREGCIVPTIAGGMCQLSNALYDAALKAGFEIVERHRHTKVVKGSLAEQDRDATVKWNYIDLRFKATSNFKIETDITADKLIVRIKTKSNGRTDKRTTKNHASDILNDCYSCGNTGCFRYPGEAQSEKRKGITAFVLDEKWTEHDEYLKTISTASDVYILPSKNSLSARTDKFNWTITRGATLKTYSYAAIKRVILSRLYLKRGKNVFASSLSLDKQVAKKTAKLIPINATHLIISQNLLPFLWDEGVLGGRTYQVLMTRLPMETLHAKLDAAYTRHPESLTLNDFRAPLKLVKSETEALNRAAQVVTPHTEIASLFNNKSIKLEWDLSKFKSQKASGGGKLLFPASAVARKGAFEIKRLAKELELQLIITGNAIERDGFWGDFKIENATDDIFKDIGLVVYPAYVEHSPKLLLKAIAAGLPVITTAACGIPPGPNVVVVPTGDYEALKEAVQQHLKIVTKKDTAAFVI